MELDEKLSINKIHEVLSGTSGFTIESSYEFDKGIDHIINLIYDAKVLYENGSYSSSFYISVIVIEEVAKLHMGLYIQYGRNVKKDKLFDHKTKDIIGCGYTVTMGSRLIDAIGVEEIKRICNEAYSGKLKERRENAFYCLKKDGKLAIPYELYSREDARNVLLFAIESFDDNLVGYTDYSLKRSEETDLIFDEVCMENL